MSEKTKAEIKEKFEGSEGPIHVIGRHIAVTDAMKNYALEKLSRIERLNARILDVTIVMDVQKQTHIASFILNVNNTRIKVSGRSDSMYVSIDQAISRLHIKLKRYLNRLHEHHAKHLSVIDMNVNIVERALPLDEINDQIEEEKFKQVEEVLRPHQVVSRETRPLKVLNQEEAIMKMELSEDLFLLYRSEEDQKLKVIYRRNDNNYGIIEPEK